MAQSRRKRQSEAAPRIGKQLPRHRFVLNPHQDVRLTVCPICRGRTLLRKIPLVVHVDPMQLVVLNKHCRYCRLCDLVMAHKDEVEAMLAAIFAQRAPDVIGNDYLVIGTLDRADWSKTRKNAMTVPEIIERLHDFTDVLKLEYDPGGWRRA